MTTVIFDPSKQQPSRSGAYALDGFVLKPGTNSVTAAELAKLQKHPAWSAHLNSGAVKVVSESEDVTELDALLLINTAEHEQELEVLPGIGPANAKRIFLNKPDGGYESLQEAAQAPDLTAGIDWDAIASWEAD